MTTPPKQTALTQKPARQTGAAGFLKVVGVLNVIGGVILMVDGNLAGLVLGILGCALCFGFAELIDYLAYIADRSAELLDQARTANDKLDAIAKRDSDPVAPPLKSPVLTPLPQRADEPYRL